MTLMKRRRALIGANKSRIKPTLVNGVYKSTVTVTNGNTVDFRPLPQGTNVTIPLTHPITANQSIALMTSSVLVKNIHWYAVIQNVGNKQINSTAKPSANRWYEIQQSGTVTALIFVTSEAGYNHTAEFSLKIDGEVVF